ncbi:thioesterase family protein [Streptomyces sp. NA04227]|uniref:acyl-CoA thioesterase n=1 Tax=Streptomyces sp. NA04227 TaxID=2742136 RepID=UPI0015900828|nr:acyl-CoA thioesterase domain-containing protein [Streptomyces sp. NA04227]QKW08938.1 thioesterase family protein [Streptomyces sp. NA04227]
MTSVPESAAAPEVLVADQLLPFTEQLRLEPDGEDRFLGQCHPSRRGVGFGGSVLSQSLAAAARTAPEGRPVHSLHAYFLRPVMCSKKVSYSALRLRDGRSYSLRQVNARQSFGDVLSMHASFKAPEEPSYEQQSTAPKVPGPEGLPDGLRDHPAREVRDGVELRYLPPEDTPPPSPDGEIRQYTWSRIRTPLPDEPAYHACALAYLSDVSLAATAIGAFRPVFPVVGPPPARMASLDHAMWFHRPLRADTWLLFAQRSKTAADGRTLCHGEFWTEDGELVASASQEALMYVARRTQEAGAGAGADPLS